MKTVVLLGMVVSLVLALVGTGCSSDAVRRFSSNADDKPALLKEPGFSIRAEAQTWPELAAKLKPTFTWNHRDMLWIGTNRLNEPAFILDEAWRCQPANQPAKWVMLESMNSQPSQIRWELSLGNLRAVPPLVDTVPEPKGDGGEIGDFAVKVSSNSRGGTVYEIGWESIMGYGVAHPVVNRRIYVLRRPKGGWVFLGEGPSLGRSRGLWQDLDRQVTWNPLTIHFQLKTQRWEETGEEGGAGDRKETIEKSVLTAPIDTDLTR